jgi:hypothetical protein
MVKRFLLVDLITVSLGLREFITGAVIGMAGYCKQSYKEITKQ